MSKPTSYPSVLLMESHGLAPNVRSTSFSSTQVWSKLYQAGPYFVDLMLGPGDRALALHGELMADSAPIPTEGTITLRDQQDTVVSTTTAIDGAFSLQPDNPGSFHLDLMFNQETLTLSGIEV